MEPERSLIREFINGGWLVPVIGAASMLARLLSSNVRISLLDQFKKVTTAALAAGIAWFVLEQTDISSLYKAIVYGIIGVISPEVIDGIVDLGRAFAKNPLNFFKRK